LLATDGSLDATLAAQTAIELCERTSSELHVVHVGEYLPTLYAYTEEEPIELQRTAQRLLDAEPRGYELRVAGSPGPIFASVVRASRSST
jgi:nucleotide-binding universal stress UspA family protein